MALANRAVRPIVFYTESMKSNIPSSSVVFAGLLCLLAACEKPQKPVMPPVEVKVSTVTQGPVSIDRTWVGTLTGYQNADIRAQVTGYLLTQNYTQGAFMKKGDILFTIDPRPFQAALAQARADLAQSQAKAQLAQVTLVRQTQLFKTNVISQQEFDTATQNTAAAIAQVAAAQANVDSAQINLNYCTIIAPFDGIAGNAQAQLGDLVGPGGNTVLTQMSQVNPIQVNFPVTEQEYLKSATLLKKLENTPAADRDGHVQIKLSSGEVYPYIGKFDFVNRQVDVKTGTILIAALFPNDGNILRPGGYVNVSAPVDMIPDAILVPQQAVVELQGNFLVSTLGPDNVVVVNHVKLGEMKGQMWVVTEGLKAGDTVIVEGVEKVKPGMKVVPSPYQPATPPGQASPSPAAKEASPSPANASPSATPSATAAQPAS